ncbi:4a-hydroxytetrahydrobiopterin dehydratase [Hymenobacter weizhouensis]|uniref:4a-hydroxytetrahydrobiopterin dehydratase n=1 Tax=Hymenobacter sp. YIM 151500-1 TaxID=2987689 RepID=UPI00222760BF|nr:4a-hydroxytetrahydrobiopterin dehydratase [Hymenobacter sp. YIM 151500-1]UYZ62298.1 4a-hydroxytetrahydrobiopterin dehydratase [Hymenobacter sp. YIM 151500-1]
MWTEHDNALNCRLRFPDFKTAFAFMTAVAEAAEAQDHHPWWANEYNTVEFRLRTHDAGNTVTRRNYRLADTISQLAAQFGGETVA